MKTVCNLKLSHLLIVGDFKIKEINWENVTTDTVENHISARFIECTRDCFLYQRVFEPTRFISDNIPSILDLFLTNEENMISNLSYLPGLGKSDHVFLNLSFNCYIDTCSTNFKRSTFSKKIIQLLRKK